MVTSTSASARRLEEPEKPEPGACKKCGRPVEPFLRPGWGAFPAKWLVGDVCSECIRAAELEREAEARRAVVRGLLREAELPAEAGRWDFETALTGAEVQKGAEDFKAWQRAYQDCLYWHGGRSGLYLYGPAGLGKTILACCALKRFIADNESTGLFVSVTKLFGLAEDSTAQGSPARETAERAKEAGLLVLDEIGAVRPRLKQRELLLGIVDERVSERRPTIYTSNYGPGELDKRLRDKFGRAIDRIVGSTKGVPFAGKSFRVLGAEARWR